MQWYYAVNNQRQGPIAQAELAQLAASGAIKPDTLVWRQGMAEWQPYASVAASLPAAVPGTGDDTEVCAVSGKRYPKREMIQYEGKWIAAEHRDEYFQRLREGVTIPGQFVYGNFWPRFCAKFVDGIILFIIGVIINASLGALIFGNPNYMAGLKEATASARLQYQVISNAISIVVGLGYSVFFIARYSATPGKMALGLKLVQPDGSPLGIGRIIGRHFAEWLSWLTLTVGYIIAAFDDERRALHDRICDTRVIKVK
jgi:uncharacterized RDD family membrane protein YckC